MRNKKLISFSLISIVLLTIIFFMGCSSVSKSQNDIGIVKHESEKLGPVEEQVDFEEIVKGKVWYTKLENEKNPDGNTDFNRIYQIKLQFNTTSKTFTKETYTLERYGRTNSYKTAGYNSQKGNYYYGEDGDEIFYELTIDYDVNANSSRKNNTIDSTPKPVNYSVENENIIIWDGKKYYEKNALEGFSIGNFTNKREVTIEA